MAGHWPSSSSQDGEALGVRARRPAPTGKPSPIQHPTLSAGGMGAIHQFGLSRKSMASRTIEADSTPMISPLTYKRYRSWSSSRSINSECRRFLNASEPACCQLSCLNWVISLGSFQSTVGVGVDRNRGRSTSRSPPRGMPARRCTVVLQDGLGIEAQRNLRPRSQLLHSTWVASWPRFGF